MAVVVIVAALVGELPLTLWLLVKGVNADRWQEQAAEPALRLATAGAV
jgi:hypothetical protein